MTEETQPQVETVEAPVVEAPVSLRETIEQARDDVKEKQEATPEKQDKKVSKSASEPTGRQRDEAGKFAAKTEAQDKQKAAIPVQGAAEAAPVIPKIAAPAAYTGAVKTEWEKLPLAVQQELLRREQDVEKGFTKFDEERNFGKQIKEMATPYLATIRAEGGDIPKAFSSFLDTAYKLRTKSPQEKGQILLQLARDYGADLSQALPAGQGGTTQQGQAMFDPRLHELTQTVQGLKGTIEQQQALHKQQEEMRVNQVIDAFVSDKTNYPYFEQVSGDLESLLGSMFKTGSYEERLKKAYDYAVYANPQTRSTLLEQTNAQAEEKRLADQKAKAEAAKKAGSSIKGSPGVAALKNGKIQHASLRDEIAANLRAAQES